MPCANRGPCTHVDVTISSLFHRLRKRSRIQSVRSNHNGSIPFPGTQGPTPVPSGRRKPLKARSPHHGCPMRKPASTSAVSIPPPDEATPKPGPQPYFLIIDQRFRVPIFVFVETDPQRPTRAVTIEFAPVGTVPRRCWVGVRPGSAIGRDPEHWEQFKEFSSDGHVRAAGFLPIEPRYVGPSWESYLGAFRPEGERPTKRHAGIGVRS
jgi:hypothetical protein